MIEFLLIADLSAAASTEYFELQRNFTCEQLGQGKPINSMRSLAYIGESNELLFLENLHCTLH